LNGTQLDDVGVSRWALTGTDGSFAFGNVLPGYYTLEEELQEGWINTTSMIIEVAYDQMPADLTVVLEFDGNDFGNVRLGEICGVKFFDANANGTRDCDDAGEYIETFIPGWEITLSWEDPAGVPHTLTAFTDEEGRYCFTGLKPGITYTVGEVLDQGWINITPLSVEVLVGPGTPEQCDHQTVDFGNIIVGPPGHTIGFWKNNIIKNLNGWTHGIQVSKDQLKQYLWTIVQTYYIPLSLEDRETLAFLNLTQASQWQDVTDDELMDAYTILSQPDPSNMTQKAEAQTLCLLFTEQFRNEESGGTGYSDAFVYIPSGVGDGPMIFQMSDAILHILDHYMDGEYSMAHAEAGYINELPMNTWWEEYY